MGEFLTEGRRPQVYQSQRPGGVNIETLAAHATLTDKSSNIQVLDPGGSDRNVTLPAARDGIWWQIANTADGDETLTILDASAATVASVAQGESVLVVVDGTTYGIASSGAVAIAGFESHVYEVTISPSAVSTAVITLPAGHVVDGTWMNIETVLTGGGTTATVSLGIAGDVDELGTMTSDDYTTQSDLLAANSKWSALASATPLTGRGDALGLFSPTTRAVVVSGAAAGGAAAGDTALTVGSVKIRIAYRVALTMEDA